ncbi:MAG: hypothetical protein WKF72_11335 [Nocardioidaceae bacterium]
MTTTVERLSSGLIVLAILIFPTACDADGSAIDASSVTDGGEPADPSVRVDRPQADFEVEIAVGASDVVVTYTFTNGSDDELLVVNRLPAASGASVEYVSDIAYITGQDDGRALVSQRAFAWPDSDRIDFGQAPQVGATRVEPGGQVAVELSVPLPLERSQPFGDDLGYGTITLPDPVIDVMFCLGVIAPPYAPSLGLEDQAGVTTLAHGNESHAAQYLFCSDPVEL